MTKFINLITHMSHMSKIYRDLKVEEEVFKKFRKAKNLREFKIEESITISDFLEEMLESEFKKYDGLTITPKK